MAIPIERFDISPQPEQHVIAFQVRAIGTAPAGSDSQWYRMTPLQARILVQVIEENLLVMQQATGQLPPGQQRH